MVLHTPYALISNELDFTYFNRCKYSNERINSNRFHLIQVHEKKKLLSHRSGNKFSRNVEITEQLVQSNSIIECSCWNVLKQKRNRMRKIIFNAKSCVKHNAWYMNSRTSRIRIRFSILVFVSSASLVTTTVATHSVQCASGQPSRRVEFKQRKNQPHISCFSPFGTTTKMWRKKTSCERVRPLFCRCCCCYCCDDDKSRHGFN